MSNRKLIECIIKENKGIGFSEIKKKTGLATGVVQYHINASSKTTQKNNAVLEKGACADCNAKDCCKDKCILKLLRNDVKNKIFKELVKGKKQSEIAFELGLHKSTVSYHCKDLKRYADSKKIGSQK